MDFSDLEFPPRIAMGAQRRPGWSTTVAQTMGGQETTLVNWSKVRHSYDISFAVRNATDYDVVAQHFHSMRGRAKKFLFKDALDYRCEASRSALLDDGDSPTTDYQLAKTYGSGADIYRRVITRPRSGYVNIYRLRAGITTDITASATISYTTGRVSFTGGTVIGGDVLTWAGEFYVPCRYDTDELPGLVVNRQPGADGELLVQCESIPIVEVRDE